MGNCYISRRTGKSETNNNNGENGLIGTITLSGGFAETIIGQIISLEEQNNE